MPSEDSKPAKKEEVRDGDDEKCLNSMLKDRKKTNPNGSSTKPRPKETAKVEKKELLEDEDDDDDDRPINASFGSRTKGAKVKKEENGNGDDLEKPIKANSASAGSKKAKAKKEKNDDDDEEDYKPIKQRSAAPKSDKGLKQLKNKKEETKKKVAAAAEQNGKKRERKVYDLPGQKRDPPEERDPLRIFYETLYQQVPNSEMAQIWMMESGLLSKEEAKKVFDKKQKKAVLQKLGSPTKVGNKTPQSDSVKKAAVSSSKTKTTGSKVASKKCKNEDESSDDDFIVEKKVAKKPRAA